LNKIYIIGPVGSGKTTLSKKLSKKYNIKCYELDNIVHDKNNKRSNEEIIKLFNNIISKDKWIIEDVGRKIFIEGIKQADIIYYININKLTLIIRIIKRWLKQVFHIEKSEFNQNIFTLFKYFKWLNQDISEKKDIINYIKENNNNLIVLNKKDIIKLEKS